MKGDNKYSELKIQIYAFVLRQVNWTKEDFKRKF